MSKFKLGKGSLPIPSTPEELFDRLTKPPDGPRNLWTHQGELLAAYRPHVGTPDVAFGLPTGDGKSLVGMLVGEWRRLALDQRVAYLCPTIQLVHQAADQAALYGLNPVVLAGGARNWDSGDEARFNAGEAMALTTYSTVFNSNPILNTAQTLIFDDAHAAESFVAGAWSLSIRRDEDASLYRAAVDTVGQGLEDAFRHELEGNIPEWGEYSVRLIPSTITRRVAPSLLALLEERVPAGDRKRYALSMLKDHIDRCFIYTSWAELLIRPYIVPTFQHAAFVRADQRIYMSATLGDGGELERAFGRTSIKRLVSEKRLNRGSGRRFILLPSLTDDGQPDSFTRNVLEKVRKAIVLCPSNKAADLFQEKVLPDSIPPFFKDDIEQGLGRFKAADRGALILANRYDGIDLPDQSCRLVVFYGMPAGVHLQERYLLTTLGAAGVLDERILTRFVQGAGRCTRSSVDFAAVVVTDPRLVSFCLRSEIRKAMHPELQAELELALENSGGASASLMEMLDEFMTQGDDWKQNVEPHLQKRREELPRKIPEDLIRLKEAAPHEVRGSQLIWLGDWAEATAEADKAAGRLEGDELMPYRALWKYIAASCASRAAETEGDHYKDLSKKQMEECRGAASKTSFYRHMQIETGGQLSMDMAEADALSLELTANAVAKGAGLLVASEKRFEREMNQMLDLLAATVPNQYEDGLARLGRLLGFTTIRRKATATPDNVWVSTPLWIGIEAKSDAAPTSEIGANTIRQAASHLVWAKSELKIEPPVDSFVALVTPQTTIEDEAEKYWTDILFAISPREILRLAEDAVAAWRQTRIEGRGSPEDTVRTLLLNEFRRKKCDGPAIIMRLKSGSVKPNVGAPSMASAEATTPF